MSIEGRRGRLGLVLLSSSLGGLLSGCGGGGGGNPAAGSGQLVTLITPTLPSATTGVPYQSVVEAHFVHLPGVFQITSGGLPPGVKLDKDTGLLSGYPRQTGAFHLEIAARDGVDLSLPPGRDENFAEDRKVYDIIVDLGPPNILPQTPTLAVYRQGYSYQIDVAGGTPPFTFAQIGGALPAGLHVSPSGAVGTLPTSFGASPYAFQVRVTDANGLSDTDTLSLELIVLPLTILTSTIPEAAIGFAYDKTMQLASSGGGAPITWSQQAPVPGEVLLSTIGMEISADGHLRNLVSNSGPTTVGTFTFTLAVTDQPLQVATRQFTLIVNPGPVLSSITPNRASISGPYTATGLNFQPGAKLIFKPGPTQTQVTPTFVDSSTLTFPGPVTKPSDGSGAVDVRVVNPDLGFHTKTSAFVFPANTIAFATKGFIPSALSSTGMDAAEVTGDGRADIIHCGASGLTPYSGASTSTNAGLVLLKSAGGSPPTFTSTTLDGGNFYDCKFVDVNLDGKLDIVALGQTQIKTWINNPLGTFTPGPTTTLASGIVYPGVLAVGKLNSDSIPDVAIGVPHNPSFGFSNPNGRIDLMMGTGTGLFVYSDQANGSMPFQTGVIGMACIDSDGNGRDEIAAGVGMGNFTSSPPLNFAPTTASGTFGTWSSPGTAVSPPYYGSTTSVAVADFLGNGTQQAITTHSSTYSTPARILSLYSGANLSSQTAITPPSTVMKSVCPVDADFDLKMDFAISTVATTILVYKGGSSPTLVATLDASSGVPAVGSPKTGRVVSADLDGDGKPDILCTTSFWQVEEMAANYGSPYAHLSTGNGGSMGIVFYLNTSN